MVLLHPSIFHLIFFNVILEENEGGRRENNLYNIAYNTNKWSFYILLLWRPFLVVFIRRLFSHTLWYLSSEPKILVVHFTLILGFDPISNLSIQSIPGGLTQWRKSCIGHSTLGKLSYSFQNKFIFSQYCHFPPSFSCFVSKNGPKIHSRKANTLKKTLELASYFKKNFL